MILSTAVFAGMLLVTRAVPRELWEALPFGRRGAA